MSPPNDTHKLLPVISQNSLKPFDGIRNEPVMKRSNFANLSFSQFEIISEKYLITRVSALLGWSIIVFEIKSSLE